MKKSYLFSALAAGMVMLSACSSNDDNIANGGDNANNAKQEIVLQVANTNASTRAGRPLYSSEAKQSIENVKVIICSKDASTIAYTADVDWTSSNVVDYPNGKETTLTIPEDDKLAAGDYVVYAYGFHKTSDYTAENNTDLTVGQKFEENGVLSIKDGVKGEEIFAGSLNLTVKDGAGFKTPVVLNRQVAGTFGYFENIPYVEGATTLQLVAYQLNTQLVLGQFSNYDLNGNGKDANVNYVINGATPSAEKVVYSINLAEWFGTVADANNDGLIDADKWKAPASFDGKATFKKGSVFGGTFLIPFAKSTTTTDKTFVLQLTDDAGKVLKSWTVKLPSSDGQLKEHDLYTWGTSFTSAKATDTATNYSVVRNHLYGIGQRVKDNPTDPGNPDPENPDVPESLAKKQELVLKVNDNWEVIHNMGVEED